MSAPTLYPGVHFFTRSGSEYWHYGDQIWVRRPDHHPLGDEKLPLGTRSTQIVVGQKVVITCPNGKCITTSPVTSWDFHAIRISPEVMADINRA